MPAKKINLNFATKYKELEALVAWFEKEYLDLELAVKKLEEGAKLVKELTYYLNTVENRVRDLKI